MKITEKLPQFKNETALLVVTGKQGAVFYIASNGEIHKVESFKVDKPEYTDLQGNFQTRSGGKMVRSGSPFEPTNLSDDAVRRFLKELEDELKNVSRHHDLTSLYLFCPSHMKNQVEKVIPDSLSRKKKELVEGNHYESHPFDLLKKIEVKKPSRIVRPLTSAAQKILNKFRRH